MWEAKLNLQLLTGLLVSPCIEGMVRLRVSVCCMRDSVPSLTSGMQAWLLVPWRN